MIVWMISLMSTIINTARTPALADPNVKPFQRCVPVLSAILSSNCSCRRFIMDILLSGMRCPMVFSIDGFSTGNII